MPFQVAVLGGTLRGLRENHNLNRSFRRLNENALAQEFIALRFSLGWRKGKRFSEDDYGLVLLPLRANAYSRVMSCAVKSAKFIDTFGSLAYNEDADIRDKMCS